MGLKVICILIILSISHALVAQQGFLIGGGLGWGVLNLKSNHSIYQDLSAVSLPNLRFGYRFNQKFALIGLQPGSVYWLKSKDRVFEAIHIAGQYWIKDRLWLSAGTGITVDGPAFYTWGDKEKEGFYAGLPSFSLGAGFEVWRKNNFALDIQYRFFHGRSHLESNQYRTGNFSGIILGITWY